jgi:succinate dehydrogenase / fumarate reductase, flavoprotein subunit
MTTIPGLYAIGESNFSDHGANRLGASALMQGLADGYFVLPYTIQNYLADDILTPRMSTELPEFIAAEEEVNSRIERLMNIKGKESVDSFHRRFGLELWDTVGMERSKEGLSKSVQDFKQMHQDFWKSIRIPGTKEDLNPELEKAGRVADFIEIGELMARDALEREESCGGHFRVEHQTADGEALRHDDTFMYVSAWEYKGEGMAPELNKEMLNYENIKVQTRNYKK